MLVWWKSPPESRFLKPCNVQRNGRNDGEDDDKGIVSDIEGVLSLGGRDICKSMRYGICVFVAVAVFVGGSGCGVDISDEGGAVDGSAGNSGVGDGGERLMYRCVGGGGIVAYRSVGGGLRRSGW